MIFDDLPGPIINYYNWKYKFIEIENLYYCFGYYYFGLTNPKIINREILLFSSSNDLDNKNLKQKSNICGLEIQDLKLFISRDILTGEPSNFDKFILNNFKNKQGNIWYIQLYSSINIPGSQDIIFNFLPGVLQKNIIFNMDEWNNFFKD